MAKTLDLEHKLDLQQVIIDNEKTDFGFGIDFTTLKEQTICHNRIYYDKWGIPWKYVDDVLYYNEKGYRKSKKALIDGWAKAHMEGFELPYKTFFSTIEFDKIKPDYLQTNKTWDTNTNLDFKNKHTKGLKIENIHPGEILKIEFLAQMKISPSKLAHDINVSRNFIRELISGKRNITHELACSLAIYFDTSVHFWVNLQTAYDKENNNAFKSSFQRSITIAEKKNRFPLKKVNFKIIEDSKEE